MNVLKNFFHFVKCAAILPMICYFIAYALVLVVSLGFWVLTLTFGNGLHTIATK